MAAPMQTNVVSILSGRDVRQRLAGLRALAVELPAGIAEPPNAVRLEIFSRGGSGPIALISRAGDGRPLVIEPPEVAEAWLAVNRYAPEPEQPGWWLRAAGAGSGNSGGRVA